MFKDAPKNCVLPQEWNYLFVDSNGVEG